MSGQDGIEPFHLCCSSRAGENLNGIFHCSLIVGLKMQDPLRGGKDELFDYLVAFIHADDREALAKDAVAPPRKRLVPEILLKLARRVSPF